MTTNNNTATWALVILIGLLALLALRSIFFVLPFGFFPGVAEVFRGAGHSIGGVFRFIPLMLLPLALLALVLYPIVWLILLPFRLLGITVTAVFELFKAIIMLPARILRGPSRA